MYTSHSGIRVFIHRILIHVYEICLILTSRLSGLKSTHYWVRDDEKVGYLGLKKSFFRLRRAPSSGISLSGGQVSDGRLRRGLTVAAEHPHDMFYAHITSI